MRSFKQKLEQELRQLNKKDAKSVYEQTSKAAMEEILSVWQETTEKTGKKASYFSAEFLVGRLVYSNLFNMGVLEDMKKTFEENGLDPNMFEGIEDAALGNGGLGRLAACFLDSGATVNIALNGYGIRYKYGLFKQYFEDGFQRETADDWTSFGDPWSVRKENEKILVQFKNQAVWAVPYDMPVIGYGAKTINTLRLWQAEAVQMFNFSAFDEGNYEEAYKGETDAQAITSVLYPNDNEHAGKVLRLKQQYFFSSASMQDMIAKYKQKHGADFSNFANEYAIQLNDTHPTVSIPEFLRILVGEQGIPFEKAFEIVKNTFAYTNHTIMAEALEKWDVGLFCDVIPEVYPYVVMLQNYLKEQLTQKQIMGKEQEKYYLIDDGKIHMARIAIFASHSTNGVAALHTEILKNDALKEWYAIYPERFSNKTNGITQRRWLGLCNAELSQFITERIGDGWLTNLDELKKLEKYADDSASLQKLNQIKQSKKVQLANHVRIHEYGYELNTNSIFDVQVKRLHEYKRQFLNAFSIMALYFEIKEGKLPDFAPTTYIFGAKSAPGYFRAKGIIKYINEVAKLVNQDPQTKEKLQVLFVQNYNVSYAEKIIPASDISEQISTAGTEASGTGNMKLMLNGSVTLGTYDGANVEIVQKAGIDNNYIFGAKVEEIKALAPIYNPRKLYGENPRLKRVLDTLIDGTFSDSNTGMFTDLYYSLLEGASWHKADQYYLLEDFEPYVAAKIKVNKAYQNREYFARQCLLNITNAGYFSSDRTIREYANDIWRL